MDSFMAFGIKTVPRKQNIAADSLAVVASTFQPVEDRRLKQFNIKMLYSPSVPDNIGTFQVFSDDQQIQDFMNNERVFAFQNIGEEQAQPSGDHPKEEEEEFIDGILQLKTNTLPRGIIDLERLFDQDLVQENIPKEHIEVEETEKVNLGTEQDP